MNYPVDHARTTRRPAGETPKSTAKAPALLAAAAAVAALSIELYELTSGDARIALVAAILAVVSSVAGLRWLNHAPRRARAAELQRERSGSNVPAPRPSG